MSGPGPEETLQPVPDDIFRYVMGSFASGVSVVTTVCDGEPRGMTCTAVCSVSARPPLLLTCFRTPSATLDGVDSLGHFAVNFLDSDARSVAAGFAGSGDRFAGTTWRPGIAGVPLLDRTLAHAECVVRDRFDAGDHVVVIGVIVAGEVHTERFPLGYWRGNYVRVFRMSNLRARTDEAEDLPKRSYTEWAHLLG
jgi:flavin reductase (DIM6/NTAB) family NADH-FMN oxidoreductase RutF